MQSLTLSAKPKKFTCCVQAVDARFGIWLQLLRRTGIFVKSVMRQLNDSYRIDNKKSGKFSSIPQLHRCERGDYVVGGEMSESKMIYYSKLGNPEDIPEVDIPQLMAEWAEMRFKVGEMKSRIEKLETVLVWYADYQNYTKQYESGEEHVTYVPIIRDCGAKAREALSK